MSVSITRRGGFIGWVGLALLAVVGCEQEPPYAFRHLELQRHGWDSLSVEAHFQQRGLLGSAEPIVPKGLTVYLFNAAYDTLYAGDGRLVPLADRELADREPLMLEVCGQFDTVSVCQQEAVMASPKRLQVEHDIAYPDGWAYERGRYALRFALERQGPDGAWERLSRPRRVHGYLRAYVGGQADDAVEVPFSNQEGTFTLHGRPHYDDFHFHLTSALMDGEATPVHFDIYAGLEGQPALHLASVEKQVRKKSDDERALEVAYFVEQATDAVLAALEVDLFDIDGPEQIDSTRWTYHQFTDTYRITMAVAWEERRRFRLRLRRRYGLEGVLEVEASGANARFVRGDANEHAARRWALTIGGPTLMLGPLEPYSHDDALADRVAAD